MSSGFRFILDWAVTLSARQLVQFWGWLVARKVFVYRRPANWAVPRWRWKLSYHTQTVGRLQAMQGRPEGAIVLRSRFFHSFFIFLLFKGLKRTRTMEWMATAKWTVMDLKRWTTEERNKRRWWAWRTVWNVHFSLESNIIKKLSVWERISFYH